jgi:taurine--2-oxoglutarate transaminase
MTDVRAKLSGLLAEVFPSDLNAFYYASSGSEANEAACMMARRFTGRPKIMSRYRSYHGGTRQSLAITGDARTWAMDYMTPGVVKMVDPFPFHTSWDSDPKTANLKCLE